MIPRSFLVLATVLGLALTACSSQSDDLFADSGDRSSNVEAGEADSGSGADGSLASGQTSGDPRFEGIDATGLELTADEALAVIAAYERFLSVSDAARLGDESAQAELAGLASGAVVDEVEAWAEDNEGSAARGLSTVELISNAHVEAISGSSDRAEVRDCTEIELTSDLMSLTRAEFVEQRTVLVPSGGGWMVEQVIVDNDGTVASGPIGCVPRPIRDELEQVMGTAIEGVFAGYADPVAGADHLEGIMDPGLLVELQAELDAMVADGIYGDSPVEFEVGVVGADTLIGSRNYVVTTCTTYLEGNPSRSIETGELVDEFPGNLEPGSEVHEEWLLRTQLAPDMTTRQTVVATLRQRVVDGCDR